MTFNIENMDKSSDVYKNIVNALATKYGKVTRKNQEQAIKEIAAALPDSQMNDFGETEEERILNFMPVFFESKQENDHNKDKDENTDVQTKDKSKSKSGRSAQVDYVAPAGPGTMEGLEKLADSEIATRQYNSDNSAITELLTRTPDLKTVLAGKTVVPFMTDKTLNNHRKNLVKTPDNIKAFDDFEAARKNNTPVPVAVPSGDRRIDGVSITIPTTESGKTGSKTVEMSNQSLMCYLLSSTILRVGTTMSPIGVGAFIRKFGTTDSKGRAANSSEGYGKPYMSLVGKKQALDTFPDKLIVITEVDEANPKIKKKVSTDITFKVYEDDPDKATGTRKEKTVRVGGYLDDYPNMVVKEQYKEQFPSKQPNTVSTVLTLQEKAETQKMLSNISHAISTGRLAGVSVASLDSEFLTRIKKATSEGQAADEKAADEAMKGAK